MSDKSDKNAKMSSSTDEKPEKSGNEDEKGKRRQTRVKQKEKEIREYEKLKQKIEMYYKKRLNEHAEKSTTSSQSSQPKSGVSEKPETVEEVASKVPVEPKSINSELSRIKVDILQEISEESTVKGEIQRDIVNAEEITVKRRKDEGVKPIFDRPEVKYFDQIQREKENEIFKQKQVFVHELKKLVKLLFPDEHSGMSMDRSVDRFKSRSNSTDHRIRNYSPRSPSTSKFSATSERLESSEHKTSVESEITTNGETVKSSELQNDISSEDGSLSKREGNAMFVMLDECQKEIDGRREGTSASNENQRDDGSDEAPLKKRKVGEPKPLLDPEESKLLDEWQKEIDARRQLCLKQLERGRSRRRSRSRSRSLSPYYRNKPYGSTSQSSFIDEDDMLYREYREMSRERRERRRVSELTHYTDRIPISAYYDTMPSRMISIHPPPMRSAFSGVPFPPFPPRTNHPGMNPQLFPPGT